jgi:subtilisin
VGNARGRGARRCGTGRWLRVAVLAVGASACASAFEGEGGAPRRATGDGTSTRGVLAVLPARPEPIWAQQVQELALAHSLGVQAAWKMVSLGELCVLFEVPPGRDPAIAVGRLQGDHRVRLAQPVQRFKVLESPYNDPYYDLQHGLHSLRLAAAHRLATGRGVRVALVDTGIDLDHPDLRGRVEKVGNFVDRGERSFTGDLHGTAVAGVIAATANNDLGIVGVAPQARLVALKACWHEPPTSRQAACDSYTLARALDFALGQRIGVLNLSLSGPPDPLLEDLLERALADGVVVVAAVDDEAPEGGFPAALPGVLAVRSASLAGDLPEPRPASARATLVAPGVDILATTPRGAYDFFSGSSFAAAHAAGIAALLREAAPELTGAEVVQALLASARPLGGARGAVEGGMLDACAALEHAAGRVCGE